jgi:hypothetical protein
MKKVSIVLSAVVVLLAATPLVGFSQEKYSPVADESLYGTWVNEKMMPPKTVNNPDGTFADYFPASYNKPYQGGKIEIVKTWTDSEWSVYYDTYNTLTFGATMEVTKFQCLIKVSKSGTVLEMNWISVSEFGPEKLPSAIDPTQNAQDVAGYVISYRPKE